MSASFTEAGPRTVNEDSLGIWKLRNEGLAVAIADGLGGMGSGDIASRMAVNLFAEAAIKLQPGELNLSDIAENIHSQIRSTQKQISSESTMATTLTAAVFHNSTLRGVHCGDSRAAIARADGIIRLTKDQTEAQRLFNKGKLSKSELFNYPRKNILDSALGAQKDPTIDVFNFDILVGDKILFTTDGVHEKIYLREVRSIAAEFEDPTPFVEKIRSLIQERTAEDNFSLVAVFVRD